MEGIALLQVLGDRKLLDDTGPQLRKVKAENRQKAIVEQAASKEAAATYVQLTPTCCMCATVNL